MILALTGQGHAYPEVGSNAPPYQFIHWLNTPTPDGVNVRGKVVVLEFWATWCVPCRLAIPHLNEMSRRFASDSVVFVLLTDESPDVVAQFLAQNPINAAVGCDTTGKTFDAYEIRPIPRTFLINHNGIVSWYGHPNSITASTFSRYLKTGDVPSIPIESDSLRIPELVQMSERNFSLGVNHAQAGDRFARKDDSKITEHEVGGRYELQCTGQQLSEIVSRLSGEPETRMQFIPPMEFEPTLDLSLTVSSPMEFDAGRKKALNLLCEALGLKMRRTETVTPGWTMTISDPGFLVAATASGPETKKDGSQWIATGITLGQLGEQLEYMMGEIIWNDTSVDGAYNFNLPVYDLGGTRKTLQTQYGISLEPASRPVMILVLEAQR